MMIWALVAVLALLIPILAILMDSQVGQALADRLAGGREGEENGTADRLASLEAEVDYLAATVEKLQEETRFLRSLLEAPPEGNGGEERRLGPGD